MLGDGLAPMSYAQGSQVRLSAFFEGIGPVFKIKLQLTNASADAIQNVRVVLNFSENVYKMKSKNPVLPLMVPNVVYNKDVLVENIDPAGSADLIRVFVFNEESTLPLITANLSMPMSEQNFFD